MQTIYYLFFIIIIATIIVYYFSEKKFKNKKEDREVWPYKKKDYFFNQSERKFYYTLSEILNNKFFLFSKVRISDLLYLSKYQKEKQRYRNKIQSKHIDFIVCDKQNIKPLLAIELDGSSHLRNDRIERDKFVNEIFKDAGLPILHIKVCDSYDKAYLFDIIEKKIELEDVQSKCT